MNYILISLVLLTLTIVTDRFSSKKRLSAPLGFLSIAFFIMLIVSNFRYQTVSTEEKFLDLGIMLLMVGIVSILAGFLGRYTKLKPMFIALAMMASFAIGRAVILHQQKPAPKSWIEQSGEFMVQIDDSKLAGVQEYIEQLPDWSLRKAFELDKSTDTNLDKYYILDVPNKHLEALKTLKQQLQKQQLFEAIEFNDIESNTPIMESAPASTHMQEYVYKDPMNKNQWALSKTNMQSFYTMIQDADIKHRAKLFVLDTGIDTEHEDLKQVYKDRNKKHDVADRKGHGTHCAGIAAAMTGNNIGISSFNADAMFDVHAIKVLNDSGFGSQARIIQGVIDAVDEGADVISMSLGRRSVESAEKAYNEASAYAKENNVIIVVAAGNSSANAKYYSPANANNVITVAAINESGQLAKFSNTVEDVKRGIAAPGKDILSTVPQNGYKTFSGTSMATPFVAGFVSVLRCMDPNIDLDQVFNYLRQGASASVHSQSGFIIDPANSLNDFLTKNKKLKK